MNTCLCAFSAILPRLDPWKLGDLERVNSINSDLKRSVNDTYLKNIKFVDFSEQFLSNWKIRKECYRFFYERQLDEPDLCHLSDEGNVRFNGKFTHLLLSFISTKNV